MTEQSRWHGLLVEHNHSGLWCAVRPWIPDAERTFCGEGLRRTTAATSDQPPTCPECLRAMEAMA